MNQSLGDRLQSLPREALYLILFAGVLAMLLVCEFVKIPVPNKPDSSSVAFFTQIAKVPADKPILIQTDWTNSSRGESGGQFEALIRTLMRRKLKFAIYSGADPQAPQVARDVIARINAERKAKGEAVYERWNDWIDVGYFPAVDATNKSMATSLRNAFSGRKDAGPGMPMRDIFKSPVLQGVNRFSDLGCFVLVTASNTSVIVIQRLSDQATPVLMMVTGVMGPETLNYYASGQIKGLCNGLKGVYDIETMMEYGVNTPVAGGGSPVVNVPGAEPVPGFPGEINFGKGGAYYPTLHVALTLLILAVAIGNIGMYLSRKGGKK